MGQTLSPIVRLQAQEEAYLRNKQTSKKRSPAEQAVRASLDMLGKAGCMCSEITMRRIAEVFAPVFADETDCSRYFHNRQGRLFQSNFDNNPRQPFAIHKRIVDGIDEFMDDLAAWIAQFREEVFAENPLSLRRVTDLFHLERALFAWRMKGIPDGVPSHLALPEELRGVFSLPTALQLRLAGETVSSAVLRKIFNNYFSRLTSLAAVLLRPRFFIRCKFQRAGDNELLYAPSQKQWNAPERLFSTEKPIGAAARAIEVAFEGDRKVLPGAAVTFLIRESAVALESTRAWMRQSPHDWFFAWPGQPPVESVSVSKNGLGNKLQSVPAARLVGAPAYKGVLDTRLANPNEVEIGDVAILFDQHFSQTCLRQPDGQMVISCSPTEAFINLALPVKEFKLASAVPSFTRYVAIDLGERGLGYAVFDAATNALVDKGRVAVRSMHRLVQDDRIGKRAASSINKFRAAYDRAEERRRENVVGDFCNAINRLMWYYDAFPVLEYAAGGASKSVDKVYEGVASRYLYNTSQTVDAERSAYWCGASYWKHNERLQYKFDKATGKKGKTPEPLSLFPGVGASAYGTSQRCSCCGRNPIEEIRDAMKSGTKSFTIREGGFVTLPGGDIQLFFSAPESERAEHRRRNERTPLNKPADAMQMKGEDLRKAVYRNLRQAPLSRRVQDTTISQYHCLYADCGKVMHAEENAAINIGHNFAEMSPA